MKHGATWYKRVPADFLGGIQRMTDRQHAVYSVLIDLIYVHGGECMNDPKFISGHFSNVGIAAARNTISELVDMGKIEILENGNLSQKRARNEVKTREISAEFFHSSGVLGAEKRWGSKENKELPIATPIGGKIADKIREDNIEKAPPTESPKKRAIPLPKDFDPDLQPAVDEGLQPQSALMSLARFKDHAQANGRTQIDWLASWRLWYRNDIAKQKQPRGSPSRAEPRQHPVIEELDRRRDLRNAELNDSRIIDHER